MHDIEPDVWWPSAWATHPNEASVLLDGSAAVSITGSTAFAPLRLSDVGALDEALEALGTQSQGTYRGVNYRTYEPRGGGWGGGWGEGRFGDEGWDTNTNDSGGGGSWSPEDDYPIAAETPCVETTFAGADYSVSRANNAALAAANAIKGKSQAWEWGAFIYVLDGHIYYTEPFTDQDPDRVQFKTSILPDGAHVLGIVHSHPDDSRVDDRTPSPADWDDVYDSLAGKSANGKTIDSNLLMYIYTDEDGKTRVYDNTDDGFNQRDDVTCALEK